MPLGSSGGCHTIRTDVSLTSGNTSLTGGPGADEEKYHVIRCRCDGVTWARAKVTEEPWAGRAPSRPRMTLFTGETLGLGQMTFGTYWALCGFPADVEKTAPV